MAPSHCWSAPAKSPCDSKLTKSFAAWVWSWSGSAAGIQTHTASKSREASCPTKRKLPGLVLIVTAAAGWTERLFTNQVLAGRPVEDKEQTRANASTLTPPAKRLSNGTAWGRAGTPSSVEGEETQASPPASISIKLSGLRELDAVTAYAASDASSLDEGRRNAAHVTRTPKRVLQPRTGETLHAAVSQTDVTLL